MEDISLCHLVYKTTTNWVKSMARREGYSVSVLRTLEAESIHILRGVAYECDRPVMMYSIGKDSWRYIELENIAIVPLYFAEEREVVVRGTQLIPLDARTRLQSGEKAQKVMCRYRPLGCYPCTEAVRSTARTVAGVSAPYEQPTDPALALDRAARSVESWIF